MSDILGFVVSIALIYFGIKVAFKFIKWIGINDNLNMYINDHLRMYTSDYALI